MEDITGWNYLEGSDNLSDNSGHGTGVCEILLEKAPDANLVMLKCFDGESENQTDDNTIIQAIYDSVDKYHADILNMSWTLNRDSNLLHEAIQYASENGVLILAADRKPELPDTFWKPGISSCLGRSNRRGRS